MNMTTTTKTTQYGWVCPKCGAVMAPWVTACANCTDWQYNITCTQEDIPSLAEMIHRPIHVPELPVTLMI